jgi:hypothetical protein
MAGTAPIDSHFTRTPDAVPVHCREPMQSRRRSGPTLQPGQTATIRYDAYLAGSYRLFYSTESQTPDTQSFTVDASPEQVIHGLGISKGVISHSAGGTGFSGSCDQ